MFNSISSYSAVLLISILFLFIISCTDKNQLTKISYVEYSKEDGNCSEDIYENCAKIKFRYPELTIESNEDIKNLINAKIIAQMTEPIFESLSDRTIEKMMDDFINEYNSFINETGAKQNWEFSRDCNAVFYNSYLIALDFTEFSYLGGAHPNSLTVYFNFDLSNGSKIALHDLMIEDFYFELNEIAEEIFRQDKNLSAAQDLNEAGYWFENGIFKINNNFLIAEKNLIFYFNNYEITAYAFGPTEIKIPYSEIKHLINKSGLLAKLID